MKKKDLVVVAAVIFVSVIFSYIICSKFITTPKDRQQKVELVTAISSEFRIPDDSVFNITAVNPTKLIQIGPNTNVQPFANQ